MAGAKSGCSGREEGGHGERRRRGDDGGGKGRRTKEDHETYRRPRQSNIGGTRLISGKYARGLRFLSLLLIFLRGENTCLSNIDEQNESWMTNSALRNKAFDFFLAWVFFYLLSFFPPTTCSTSFSIFQQASLASLAALYWNLASYVNNLEIEE